MTRPSFPLFQSHLDLAHSYWQKILRSGDIAIDATCGNGHDTLFLAKSIGAEGQLFAIDIQQQALSACRQRIEMEISKELQSHIHFYHQCHSTFPKEIEPGTVKLIVYNLGYLPGGDKEKTTLSNTTCTSLKNALPLICPGGAISVTCYPGHPAGKIEEGALLQFAQSLSPLVWSCCHHRWINRQDAPSLLLLLNGQMDNGPKWT